MGIDITKQFIEAAAAPRSTFLVGDLREFEAERLFDAVTMIGTSGMFDDIIVPLDRLVAMTKPGGVVVVDGGFNSSGYDVELRFRRRERHSAEPDWEFGLNQFSLAVVADYLTSRGIDNSFSVLDFPLDLERSRGPHLRSFTTRLQDGSRMVMNDLNLILPHVFLTIRP